MPAAHPSYSTEPPIVAFLGNNALAIHVADPTGAVPCERALAPWSTVVPRTASTEQTRGALTTILS